MKNIAIVLLLTAQIAAAQNRSCCQLNITQKNVNLAMNDNFASLHASPLPFVLEPKKGEMIFFPTIGGISAAAYMVRGEKNSKQVLFIFHEWWGLNDYIKQEAEKFAAELPGATVYAIDLFDGGIATDATAARELVSKLTQERGIQIINGMLGYVGKDKHIATLGWCLGGGWSLQSALLEAKQAKACVMYYGMPEQDVNRLRQLNCPVLGIFGLKDQFINPEIVKTFEANMKKAGKKLTVYNYDADHAFANPSNPKHNKNFADDAHAKVLAFLRAQLK